jgi:amino acid adenylation domain-containing protein
MSDDLRYQLAQMSPEKRVFLEQSLLERLRAGGDDAVIPRRGTDGPPPPSFAQERLWFLAQLNPEQTPYNEGSARRFRGSLDRVTLQAALDDIVRRHEALRTTYHQQDGELVQVIGQPRPVPLPVVDLGDIPADERIAAAHNRFAGVIKAPFDLTGDLMIHACLFRLAGDDHILLVVRHHIASDAWSTRYFWREFESLYTAAATDRPVPLPALPIQYADYAVWQRQQLRGGKLERELDYWRRQLADLPALQLPTDRRRPEVLSDRAADEWFSLSDEMMEELRGLGRQEGTTLHTVLLAAFLVLLARLSSQDDVATGMPIAGRTRVELETLQGLFVNTLVIRARLTGAPTFRALLRQVHQAMLDAQENQEVPFEKVVERLNPERRQNQNPLVTTFFQLRESPEVKIALPQLVVETVTVSVPHAKFDIECLLIAEDDGISGRIRYATDLFEAATVRRLIGRYEKLLAGIVAGLDRPVEELPLLPDEERRQLLGFANALSPASYATGLIHAQFEARAMSAPDALAVSLPAGDGAAGWTVTLSYDELNRRANKIAHALRRWGVGPETPVGLYFDRSLEMVAGIIGVLKAGGAYVPLDTANPPERLALIVDECRMTIVLTQQALRDTAATLVPSGAKVVCLDSDWAALDPESDLNPTPSSTPESAAYMMFTSGSTGRPKGVVVTHANIVRLFRSTEAWYGFNERDVLTLFHSFAFDISVWELWGALFYGGRIVVVPYMVSRSPDLFYRLLCREGVTMINQTPAAFHQFMEAEDPAGPCPELALRCVILGGEALELESLRPWFTRHGDRQPRLVNMYGITETAVFNTYRALSLADLDQGLGSVIGGPYPDMQMYVLDKGGRLAPIGVAGEIYLGGPCLARGYLNRPELNAQRFVSLPDPAAPGDDPPSLVRLYRSGDLGRWLPSGDLEFLGRIDYQLKIRGFRVEPGEIEAAIGRHPAVRQVVVVVREANDLEGAASDPARENTFADRRLVAYVVPTGDSAVFPAELRVMLGKTLPEYMIPDAFVFLPQLPLTAHGKIDRAALPPPDTTARETGETLVAPRTPDEETVAAVWCEVLRLDRVGVHDNFFDLGGHSLLATQVASRLSRIMGVEFPLRTLFEKPTVAEIAVEVGKLAGLRDERQRKIEAALARLNSLSAEERAALLRAGRSAFQQD